MQGMITELSANHFEVVAGRAFLRPVGRFSLQAAVELVNAALDHARAERIAGTARVDQRNAGGGTARGGLGIAPRAIDVSDPEAPVYRR